MDTEAVKGPDRAVGTLGGYAGVPAELCSRISVLSRVVFQPYCSVPGRPLQ